MIAHAKSLIIIPLRENKVSLLLFLLKFSHNITLLFEYLAAIIYMLNVEIAEN